MKKIIALLGSALLCMVGCSAISSGTIEGTKNVSYKQVTFCLDDCTNPASFTWTSGTKIMRFNASQILCTNPADPLADQCRSWCVRGSIKNDNGATLVNLLCGDMGALHCGQLNLGLNWDLTPTSLFVGSRYWVYMDVYPCACNGVCASKCSLINTFIF